MSPSSCSAAGSLLDLTGQGAEELPGHLLGHAAEEAVSHAHQDAGHLGVAGVAHQRTAVLRHQLQVAAGLQRARAAAPFHDHRDPLGRHLLRNGDLALEGPAHRADGEFDHRAVGVLADGLEFLDPGGGPLEHARVIQQGPDPLARRGHGVLAFDLHRPPPRRGVAVTSRTPRSAPICGLIIANCLGWTYFTATSRKTAVSWPTPTVTVYVPSGRYRLSP